MAARFSDCGILTGWLAVGRRAGQRRRKQISSARALPTESVDDKESLGAAQAKSLLLLAPASSMKRESVCFKRWNNCQTGNIAPGH